MRYFRSITPHMPTFTTRVLRGFLVLLTFVVASTSFLASAHAENEAELSPLADWSYRTLLRIASPEKLAPLRQDETEDEMRERYKTLAQGIAEAVESSPSLFRGDNGAYRTAALIISVGFFESGFRKDVGDGRVRGDGGRSWCYMQINIGKGPVYMGPDEMQNWYGTDLVQDPQKCFKTGLLTLRRSIGACRKYTEGDVLSAYTSGRCVHGEPKARQRWNYAQVLAQRIPFPKVRVAQNP